MNNITKLEVDIYNEAIRERDYVQGISHCTKIIVILISLYNCTKNPKGDDRGGSRLSNDYWLVILSW